MLRRLLIPPLLLLSLLATGCGGDATGPSTPSFVGTYVYSGTMNGWLAT